MQNNQVVNKNNYEEKKYDGIRLKGSLNYLLDLVDWFDRRFVYVVLAKSTEILNIK